jgi:hypothetical protein
MSERQTVSVQKGIWIDETRLGEAGLRGELEISVEPGEIRIRLASDGEYTPAETADEPLMKLAGMLSGSPVSADEIERQLYGD